MMSRIRQSVSPIYVFLTVAVFSIGLIASANVFAAHDTIPHQQSYRVAIAMSSFNFNVGRLPCPLDGSLLISFNCDLNVEEVRSVNALHEYDTVVLYQFCEIGDSKYVFFRLALTDWVAEGGKLIIYDSDRCGVGKWQEPVDYSWLKTSNFDARFTVSSAGQMGAQGGLLEIVAENKLSMKNPNSPYFVDTQALIESGSEAAADANVILPAGTSSVWCADMRATNSFRQSGIAHAYSAPWTAGKGWVIYNGLDMDALLEAEFEQIDKLWKYELLHGWAGNAEWHDVMPAPGQCIAASQMQQPDITPIIVVPPTQPTSPTATTPTTTSALVAGFSFSQELFTHKNIKFIDQSADVQGTIHTWQWDFGDGETINEQNPTHTYKKSGDYTVKLTVTNDRGTVAVREITLAIKNQNPSAHFEFEPFVPKIYQNIQFTDHSSDNGMISKWLWDFGDGNTSDKQSPTHHYEKEGLYEVKLIVSDDEEAASEPYVRYVEVQRAPVVSSFTYTQKLVTHESIEFADHSKAFAGNIIHWFWDFGDGATADTQTAAHTYEKSGEYKVSLHVSDELNTADRVEMTLFISNPKPTASFDFTPPAPKTIDAVTFANQSKDNGKIASNKWDFGDGATSEEENPAHTFVKAGSYKITLTVVDDEGVESEPWTRTIEALGTAPEASFSFAPSDPFEKENVAFDASVAKDADGEVTEWTWDFGDEMACPPDCGSGTPQKPTHAYAKPGRYTVYLIVKDNTGMESKPAKQIVDVGMRALAGFIADPKSFGAPQVPGWLGYYLKDGKISQEEVTDLLWRCIAGAYVPGTYYRPLWADFQALHELHQLGEFVEKYKNIDIAKADGYVETGSYVEGVGQAFIERQRIGKDVSHIKPPVLLYIKDKEGKLQLAGVRFIVSTPEAANRFSVTSWPKIDAAAHYDDGSTLPAKTREEAPVTNGSAAFSFWQPELYVLTIWVIDNPAGVFSLIFGELK